MKKLTVFNTYWNIKALIISHLFAFIWLIFFLTEIGFSFWRAIDQSIFFVLNGTLSENNTWTRFWAWSNVRIFDIIPLLIILASVTTSILGIPKDRLQQALIGFILLLVLMFLVRESVYEFSRAINLSGNSPSLVLKPSFRFSQIVPDIPAKDSAGHSFPGDHATVVLTWAGFIIINARNTLSISALILALLFMLPRIIGGAHWTSDNMVGGGFSALITLSWAFCTPLMHYLTTGTHKILAPLIWLCTKVPIVNQLPIFKRPQ